MRNGPVLWNEILTVVRDIGGRNPVIAGGAIRDYVLKLGDPKDIDVFIGGEPPDDMQLPEDWHPMLPRNAADGQAEEEYNGQIGTITAIQNWRYDRSDRPVQFIWIGDNDPVQYVRGFDLGTSRCYYRGSVVLGKDFLHDWHHQQITILPIAYERPRNVERSRERARALQARYPNGAAIIERGAEGAQAVDPAPVHMDGMLRVRVPGDFVVGNNAHHNMIIQNQVMPAEGWPFIGQAIAPEPNPAGAQRMQQPGNALENAPAQLGDEVPQERAGLWPNW